MGEKLKKSCSVEVQFAQKWGQVKIQSFSGILYYNSANYSSGGGVEHCEGGGVSLFGKIKYRMFF